MMIRLTDSEITLLGWDEPDQRDNPEQVRSILAKTGRKNRQELTADEWDRLNLECRYLPSAGEADASITRTATRLSNKVIFA